MIQARPVGSRNCRLRIVISIASMAVPCISSDADSSIQYGSMSHLSKGQRFSRRLLAVTRQSGIRFQSTADLRSEPFPLKPRLPFLPVKKFQPECTDWCCRLFFRSRHAPGCPRDRPDSRHQPPQAIIRTLADPMESAVSVCEDNRQNPHDTPYPACWLCLPPQQVPRLWRPFD